MSSPFPGDAAVIAGNATESVLQSMVNANESNASIPINDTNQTDQTNQTVDKP